MTWLPGQPVLTADDHAQWDQWRRCRILKGQRDRRARSRRIDYYASPAAAAQIDSMRTNQMGGDASSIINRIVTEWIEMRQRSHKASLSAENSRETTGPF